MYTIFINTGVVIRDSDGVQVAPAQSAEDPAFVAYIDWVHAGNQPTEAYVNVPDPATRIISKLECMNRFTDAELAGIYSAAKQSVAIEIWLDKFKLAENIDLDNATLIAGINSLEAAGLLSAGRAAEILA